jgi:membrane associated rhomboid family serine protease
VEDACGPLRFVAFYLMAGLMGSWLTTIAHTLGFTPDGNITGIGASGAIAGVMGAYLVLFPGTRVSGIFFVTALYLPGEGWFSCFIPIPWRFRLPALLYLFYFLGLQLYFTYLTVTEDINFGIGFLAHLGGFFSGLLIFLYIRKDVFFRYWTKADL